VSRGIGEERGDQSMLIDFAGKRAETDTIDNKNMQVCATLIAGTENDKHNNH
jgi:hypothetical protein